MNDNGCRTCICKHVGKLVELPCFQAEQLSIGSSRSRCLTALLQELLPLPLLLVLLLPPSMFSDCLPSNLPGRCLWTLGLLTS